MKVCETNNNADAILTLLMVRKVQKLMQLSKNAYQSDLAATLQEIDQTQFLGIQMIMKIMQTSPSVRWCTE